MMYEEALQDYNEAVAAWREAVRRYNAEPTEENMREAQSWAYTVSDCRHDLDRCRNYSHVVMVAQ